MKIFNRETFYIIIILGLAFFLLVKGCDNTNMKDENDILIKKILSLDTLVKEQDGSYRKLVDSYNTEKDLKNKLKNQNEDLYKIIKKNDEKLLMISNAAVTFKNEIDKNIKVNIKSDSSSSVIDFVSKYPSNEFNNDWFIEYHGKTYIFIGADKNIKIDSVIGKWVFNKFNLDIVLTEQDDGIWKYYLKGPEYLKVDDIKINSIPKKRFSQEDNKKFSILLGVGYKKVLNLDKSNIISIAGGLWFNQKNIILIEGSTNQMVGFTFLRKIK